MKTPDNKIMLDSSLIFGGTLAGTASKIEVVKKQQTVTTGMVMSTQDGTGFLLRAESTLSLDRGELSLTVKSDTAEYTQLMKLNHLGQEDVKLRINRMKQDMHHQIQVATTNEKYPKEIQGTRIRKLTRGLHKGLLYDNSITSFIITHVDGVIITETPNNRVFIYTESGTVQSKATGEIITLNLESDNMAERIKALLTK